MKLLWGLLFTAALAYATQGCSIQPQVTVEKPVVNVDLCLAIIDGQEVKIVGCDAGTAIPIFPTPPQENDASVE